MGVLDGMTSILNGVFGDEVTFVDRLGSTYSVRAVFREIEVDDPIADGRKLPALASIVRVPRDVMPPVVPGWTVRPATAAPRTFRVLHVDLVQGPAADGFVTVVMEPR